jgi:sigma-B regulation protein RsbU (phosphoserine phosphatase)
MLNMTTRISDKLAVIADTDAWTAEIAECERLGRELETARRAYEGLFPSLLPSVAGLDYCGANRPAFEVGGDYFDFLDFLSLPNPRLGIAIGDVSGKGLAGAMLMPILRTSLRGLTTFPRANLGGLMAEVNRLVYEALASNHFASFFYAEYKVPTRRLDYVNAGHNPPIVLRNRSDKQQIIRLDAGGGVLGLFRHSSYCQAAVVLEPGDLVIAYTDGLSEAMNKQGQLWGEDRLIQTAQDCASRNLSAAETIDALLDAANSFACGAPQRDDIALVILRAI